VTCYQCQEHCPQNVKVTDILYQLKNLAVENARRPSEDDTAVSEAV
jgi:heterodisulfide reductase subunit C